MENLVSILIPAYNVERWIGSAVSSALNQNWAKKEIIIVDDGSTDKTYEVARKFESKIVKLIWQENRGASSARNKALSFAQGDFIQWLDADDLLDPEKISRQIEGIDSENEEEVLLSSAWGRFYFRHERANFLSNCLWQDLKPLEWILMKMDENAWMAIESWLVCRKLTDKIGPWDEALSMDDDGEYFCRLVSASKGIKFIPEAKSYCRIGNFGSLSSENAISEKKIKSQFQSMTLQIKYLLTLENSERTRSVCLKYLQRWISLFYSDKEKILQEVNNIANSLGGELLAPDLGCYYNFMKNIFGWDFAKNTQDIMRKGKETIFKNWDRLLYNLFYDKS